MESGNNEGVEKDKAKHVLSKPTTMITAMAVTVNNLVVEIKPRASHV